MSIVARFLWATMDNGTKERAFQEVWVNTCLSLESQMADAFIYLFIYIFCIIFDITLPCDRLQKWGLNTYLYAPKDDYKHRMFWREMYSVEEAGENSEE